MPKIDIASAMEQEILDTVQETVNQFPDDYDPRNLSAMQTDKIKRVVIATAKHQAEIMQQLKVIAATLDQLVKIVK